MSSFIIFTQHIFVIYVIKSSTMKWVELVAHRGRKAIYTAFNGKTWS